MPDKRPTPSVKQSLQVEEDTYGLHQKIVVLFVKYTGLTVDEMAFDDLKPDLFDIPRALHEYFADDVVAPVREIKRRIEVLSTFSASSKKVQHNQILKLLDNGAALNLMFEAGLRYEHFIYLKDGGRDSDIVQELEACAKCALELLPAKWPRGYTPIQKKRVFVETLAKVWWTATGKKPTAVYFKDSDSEVTDEAGSGIYVETPFTELAQGAVKLLGEKISYDTIQNVVHGLPKNFT